jgi:hypothetical protein
MMEKASPKGRATSALAIVGYVHWDRASTCTGRHHVRRSAA